MSISSSICLQFGDDVPKRVRSRISYTFQVFAAVYGHRIAEAGSSDKAVSFFYSSTPPRNTDLRLFHVPALYSDSSARSGPPQLVKHRYADEDFYLAFGIDDSGRPDWLGEIFQWLSSSYEASIAVRDGVGRIPYSGMIFSRSGISPLKPYASLLMAWMESVQRHGDAKEMLPKAPSPLFGTEHLVVCSHDIDFYFVGRASTMVRLIKNLGIALCLEPSWSYFYGNLKMMAQLLRGKRVGDFLPALLKASRECDFRSTIFAVARRRHRRDPNYELQQIASRLRMAEANGFSIGVHGSYRSVVEDRALGSEAHALAEGIEQKPIAGRQHWLRFNQHGDLFANIERAGLLADSTLGFSGMVGFRNGASFAFPPYDFVEEKPHGFLEIPMVLMDGNLLPASRALGKDPQHLADEVLGESRKCGWGGIALLWHNPMEPLSVPEEINRVFWSCAKKQKESGEKWVSVDQFLACCIRRYQEVGLLGGIQIGGNLKPVMEEERTGRLLNCVAGSQNQ